MKTTYNYRLMKPIQMVEAAYGKNTEWVGEANQDGRSGKGKIWTSRRCLPKKCNAFIIMANGKPMENMGNLVMII